MQNQVTNGIDMSKVRYHVKMAYTEDALPTTLVSTLFDIGGVKGVESSDGSTTYYSQEFKTISDAESGMSDYRSYGLENLEV